MADKMEGERPGYGGAVGFLLLLEYVYNFVMHDNHITSNKLFYSAPTTLKSCPREDFMMREHVECHPCQGTEALMKAVNAEVKSSLKISDFPRLHEEFKKSDDTSVPACLDYVEKGIGRNIAAGSIFGDDILVLARSLFCAAVDEMHNMKLEDINEAVMRKWGSVFRDCKKMDLDVEFAEEHLKKIAHAYFVSLLEEEEEEELPGLNVVCSMLDTECFEDGAPLSKGILLSAPMEPTRAP